MSDLSLNTSSAYAPAPPSQQNDLSSSPAKDKSTSTAPQTGRSPEQSTSTDNITANENTVTAQNLSQGLVSDQGSSDVMLAKQTGVGKSTSATPVETRFSAPEKATSGQLKSSVDLSQGVIIEKNSSGPGKPMSGGRTQGSQFFSSVKNNNGAPLLAGPISQKASQSRGGPAAKAAAATSSSAPRKGGPATKAAVTSSNTSSSTDPISTSTSSSSNGFNVLAYIEAAGVVQQNSKQENALGRTYYNAGEANNTQQQLAQEQSEINFNVQAEQQQQQSSGGKNAGSVMLEVVTFGAVVPPPKQTTTSESITTTLTLPNGETRSTTITGESDGSGSMEYTRSTKGARGQTTEVSGTITKSSNDKTTQNGSEVSATRYTKTETGSRTTAGGRTIDEAGATSDEKIKVTDGRTGRKDKGILDGSSINLQSANRRKVHAGHDDKEVVRTDASKSDEQVDMANEEIQDIETIEAMQNVRELTSQIQPNDWQSLGRALQTIANAVVFLTKPAKPSEPSLEALEESESLKPRF